MAAGIVYLDVDDEITSAASRIRSSPETKVALVVPYGSRIATSRMNFRLLSREAVVSNRRLSIVSGDAAARSLAASAGLPVFATVAEYEASLGGEVVDDPAEPAVVASEPAAGRDEPTIASETVVMPPPPPADGAPTRKSQAPRRPPPDEPIAAAAPLAAAAATASIPATAPADEPAPPRLPPVVGSRLRAPVVALIALLVLALVVAGVGTYLLLPSADIVITPRREPISIELTVSADPEATSVDPVGLVVPADRLDIPVEVTKTFQTTGVRVEESPAHGSVTFTNYDTGGGVSIPKGSIVSTEGGVRFRTNATVALQPAAVFPAFQPTSDSVAVTAVKAGEAGNVPANTIRVVPQGQNPDLLKVNNPADTSGGVHTETPEVKQPEIDKAIATLQADLQATFDAAVASGAGAPSGTTLFPKTAQLGAATPSVDPATLVGQAVDSFDLTLSAHGTVIAVDPKPVESIARQQLQSRVTAGHRLLDDSTDIEVGEGLVGEDGSVSFLATARAAQVAIIDPAALRDLVKGKTAADAAAALQPYGSATVTLWPDWASTVTTVDSRLSIRVAADSDVQSGPSGAPSRAPSARPSSAVQPSPSRAPSPAPS